MTVLCRRLGQEIFHCAVTRQKLNGTPKGGFVPTERFDLCEAIDAYTIESAYCEFQEHRKGRLLPGYLADLVILDRDIFSIPVDEIRYVRADATMVGGRFVFERG